MLNLPEKTKLALAVAAVFLAILIGWVLRTAHNGQTGIPGDELEIWRICENGSSAWAIFRGEIKAPISMLLPALTRLWIDTFGLGLTLTTIRVPCAAMGTLCILFVYLSGRILGGRLTGMTAALLLAFNACHIQCSREVYPYILSATGAAACTWAILSYWVHRGRGLRVQITTLLVFLLGQYAMSNASVAAWPAGLCIAAVFFVTVCTLSLAKRRHLVAAALIALTVMLIFQGKVSVVVIAAIKKGGFQHGRAESYGGSVPLWDPMGFEFLTAFAWGATAPGFLLLAVAAAGLVLSTWKERPRAGRIILLAVLGGSFVGTMVGRYLSVNPFYIRFLAPVMTGYVLALALGVTYWWRLAVRNAPAMRRYAVPGLLLPVLALACAVPTGLHASRMKGRQVPYKQIVDWADRNLPAGTPIVCDRYFDAWNEFRFNPPASVSFMSTRPNEPKENYRNGFRESVKRYLIENPDAAFYETKMYWTELGPWDWPRAYFARSQAFVDEHFLRLLEMNMAYRQKPDDYPRDWLPKTIYYNTTADLVERARIEGRPVLGLFAEGWKYLKTRDLSDWRVMTREAFIDLYNVTDAPVEVEVVLVAVAPTQKKSVVLQQRLVEFPAGQGVAVRVAEATLPPGRSSIRLVDPGSGKEVPPLMVKQLVVKKKEATQQPD